MTSASSKQQSYYSKEVLGRNVKISFGEPGQQHRKFYVGQIIGVEIKYRKKRKGNEVKHYIKFEDGHDSVWMDLTHMESIGCLKWPQATDIKVSSSGWCPKVSASYETYDDSVNQDDNDEEEEEASSTDTDSDPEEEEEEAKSGLEEEEDNEEQKEATNKSASPSGVRKKKRTWDEAFESVKAFCHQTGDGVYRCDREWSSSQRYNKHNLSSQQIQKLDSINFDWETRAAKLEKQWNKMFGFLKEYKLQNGNTRVPERVHSNGEWLGKWVSTQMRSYRENMIRSDRKERLENIGFEWCRDERLRWKDGRPMGKFDDVWNKKFSILKEYKDLHGDTLLPRYFEDGDINGERVKLGLWVQQQRKDFQNGLLKTYRQEQLENIGFVFQIDETNVDLSLNQRYWEIMLERLKEYKKETGHCRVPRSYKDPRKSELPASLGKWVESQRHRFPKDRKHPVFEERKRLLASIGFEF